MRLAGYVALGCLASATPLRGQSPAGAHRASVPFEVPAWAYPSPAQSPTNVDTITRHRMPGSTLALTYPQALDRFAAPDWHPRTHPKMPTIVAHGRKPAVFACAFCHLPDGAGRPENAMLAGLPAEYIVQQVADWKTHARQSAGPARFVPNVLMQAVADSVTLKEAREAADYFSRLTPRRRARVVETTRVPRTIPGLGLHLRSPAGGLEPLGRRLVEMPSDIERHELHDSRVSYVAYVPPGSVARGRVLATKGSPSGVASCASCHGPQLRGVGPVPPIAGRSPSYLLRQLFAFRTGTRASAAGAPMRDLAAKLDLDDMIAAAAYAATLAP